MSLSSNPQILTDLGINLKIAIAGFWGGVCNAFVLRTANPKELAGSIIVGLFTANYLGQVAVKYIGDWVGELGSGFIVGLSAMAICQGILAASKLWKFSRGAKDA